MLVSNDMMAIIELIVLYVAAILCGNLISQLPSWIQNVSSCFNILPAKPQLPSKAWPVLPTLLGMIIAGIVAANVNGGLINHIPDAWSLALRKTALTVILARAGLSLDAEALKSRGFSLLRLASIPCLFEAAAAAALVRWLSSMEWPFCLCLGFLLSAIGPGVVVPSMLALQEQGYGTAKGIPTMILAACSLDPVIAICGLGMVMDIAFMRLEGGGGNSTDASLRAALVIPITIVGGIVAGVILGAVQYVIAAVTWPWPIAPLFHSNVSKFVVLVLICQGVRVAASIFNYEAAGYMAVMVAGFVAARSWERLDTHRNHVVALFFNWLWQLYMPVLFMLVGAQVDIASVSLSSVGLALAIVLVAVCFRMLVVYIIMCSESSLLLNERIFVALAWLPKAGVQAALGSAVLDRAERLSPSDDAANADAIDAGKFIVTAAVLAILITAPLGAIGISMLGPMWLNKEHKASTERLYTGVGGVGAPSRRVTTATDISLSPGGRKQLNLDSDVPIPGGSGSGPGTLTPGALNGDDDDSVDTDAGGRELVFIELV